MHAQVPPIVGFGFCPFPESSEGPEKRFVYRVVPPDASDLTPEAIVGALNDPDAPAPRAPSLSELGRERFDQWALFGTLTATSEGLEWTSFWEDKPVVSLSGPLLEHVLESALRTSPMHLWADLHLDGFREALEGFGEPETPSLAMTDGEHGLPTLADIEGLSVPYGPLKVLLLAPNDTMLAELRSDSGEEWELIEGSLGVLPRGSRHVEFAPWTLLRMQIPLTLVPQTLQWAASEEFRRPEPWASAAVMPCGEWDVPRLIVGEEGPNAAMVILPCQPDALQPELLASLEDALRMESRALP